MSRRASCASHDRWRSCYCHLGRPPCSWCTDHSVECTDCGEIVDRDDILPDGCCLKCDANRIINAPLEACDKHNATPIDADYLAMFGLGADGAEKAKGTS